jgi:hypothetical protein
MAVHIIPGQRVQFFGRKVSKRIRADHDIRLRRVRLCQAFTGAETGRMNGYPVHH